jgi:N-acylglucosamine 2-epimerase
VSANVADSVSASEMRASYAKRARVELMDSIVPFWWRTLDAKNGGVFNCWNNLGTHLVSRDKFIWSQGRFAWLSARLADATRRGLLSGNAKDFLLPAEKTVRFLQRHAFLDDGRCAFLLSEEGALKEAFAGGGPAPSIYADCFVVMGFAEFARVSGDHEALDHAWKLFEHISRRIAAGGYPTFPEPIPAGCDAHGIAMIMLNVTLVLRDACAHLDDRRLAEITERNVAAARRIFDHFMRPGGRIAEMVPHASGDAGTLLSRHLNPGHALEGLWMLLTVASRAHDAGSIERAGDSVAFQISRGWDDEYGGLLHYVDHLGGPPTGTAGTSPYEAGVRATWDTKLWWVHSEAMYATALHAVLTKSRKAWDDFERVWRYTFQTFPNPDRRVGEWIQIRDRRGAPLERVVALPVKDPYHIARNLLQIIELFSEPGSPARP